MDYLPTFVSRGTFPPNPMVTPVSLLLLDLMLVKVIYEDPLIVNNLE